MWSGLSRGQNSLAWSWSIAWHSSLNIGIRTGSRSSPRKAALSFDTTGLGTLLFTLAKLRKAGGGLALARLHPSHMDLLVIAKMETIFKVFDHEQDAINSFFQERQIARFDILDFLEALQNKSARA